MHHPAPRRPAVVPDLRRLARVLPLGCVLALGAALPAQPPPDAPPLGDPEGVPRLARAVERHGITWHFDRELVVGAFANGDPWVVGPATVERIEPACDEVGGRVLHGSMVDPDPSAMLQGYDSALFGEDGGARYDAARNVARGLSPERPLVLPPGASLVSVESRPEAGRIPSLRRASVLTVVESVPAPDGFRPPYVAGDKRMPHRAADLDFTALPTTTLSFAPPAWVVPVRSTIPRWPGSRRSATCR